MVLPNLTIMYIKTGRRNNFRYKITDINYTFKTK